MKSVIGKFPERLSLKERDALAGQWIAVELYNPQTLPLRVIKAVGETPVKVAKQLREAGEDPARYEFQWMTPAYQQGL